MACARTNRIAGRTVSGMLTIDEVIASCEKSAERYHKAFLRNKVHGGEFYQREAESDRICEEHERQLAAWLRELQERRKAPKIVRCGECANQYKPTCPFGVWINTPNDCHCHCAERRTDDKTDKGSSC